MHLLYTELRNPQNHIKLAKERLTFTNFWAEQKQKDDYDYDYDYDDDDDNNNNNKGKM
jgi:hypothetical protein